MSDFCDIDKVCESCGNALVRGTLDRSGQSWWCPACSQAAIRRLKAERDVKKDRICPTCEGDGKLTDMPGTFKACTTCDGCGRVVPASLFLSATSTSVSMSRDLVVAIRTYVQLKRDKQNAMGLDHGATDLLLSRIDAALDGSLYVGAQK